MFRTNLREFTSIFQSFCIKSKACVNLTIFFYGCARPKLKKTKLALMLQSPRPTMHFIEIHFFTHNIINYQLHNTHTVKNYKIPRSVSLIYSTEEVKRNFIKFLQFIHLGIVTDIFPNSKYF